MPNTLGEMQSEARFANDISEITDISPNLIIDDTAQGPGGTTTCAAGETRVIGRNDGDFDHIRIGDKLVVEIDGVEYSSLVFSLELAEEPDELHVTLAFHPTVGIQHPHTTQRR